MSPCQESWPRINERDYRGQLAHACWAHVTVRGGVALVMYDVTTLYFEAENEDGLRKVGMSEERRVDPQITVGLLVDPSGYPLDVHVFEGSKAETKTLLPVIEAFQTQGRVEEDRPGSAPTAQGHTPRPAACRVCLMLQARMGADPYAAEHGDHREAYAEGSAVIARTYVASAGQLTAAA